MQVRRRLRRRLRAQRGVGLLVLKPLDNALATNDRIYAVIRGSAINNDGRTSGSMGTPSRLGQEELLRAAYDDAAVSPGRVAYVEAHGTGTRAGRPGRTRSARRRPRARDERREAAPMSVRSRQILATLKAPPASPDLSRRRSRCTMAPSRRAFIAENSIRQSLGRDIPCEIPRRWPRLARHVLPRARRRQRVWHRRHERPRGARTGAGDRRRHCPGLPPTGSTAAVVGEKPRGAARARAALCRAAVGRAAPALHDVCWNAATRRTALDHRAVFVAGDRAAMADALRRYASGEAAAAEGVVRADASPRGSLSCCRARARNGSAWRAS